MPIDPKELAEQIRTAIAWTDWTAKDIEETIQSYLVTQEPAPLPLPADSEVLSNEISQTCLQLSNAIAAVPMLKDMLRARDERIRELEADLIQLRASAASLLVCIEVARHNGWHAVDTVSVYEQADAVDKRLNGQKTEPATRGA